MTNDDHTGTPRDDRGGARRRRGRTKALTFAAALALLAPAAAPGDGKVDIGDTRSALEKWVETRRILSQEKRDWILGREMLEERIDVVQREIDSFHARIDEARGSIAEADAKKLELAAENTRLVQASAALGDVIVTLEARTRLLLGRLPDPIADKLKPLSQQIPEAQAETKLSLSQRFQNVVGILNEVDKFNRSITVTSEVRSLPDGSAAEVTALYVGIGQGYYASANGKAAGFGTATPEGWTWTAADGLGPAVLRAVAILQNEEVADFVSLPIDITQKAE